MIEGEQMTAEDAIRVQKLNIAWHTIQNMVALQINCDRDLDASERPAYLAALSTIKEFLEPVGPIDHDGSD